MPPHPPVLWSAGPPVGSSQAHSLSGPSLCPLPGLGALHCTTGEPPTYTPPVCRGQRGAQQGGQCRHFLEQPTSTQLSDRPLTPMGLAAWTVGCEAATGSAAPAWTAESKRTERSVFPGTNCTPSHGVSFAMNRPTVQGSSGPLVPNPNEHENCLHTL